MADTATTGTAAAAQTKESLIRVEGLRKSFGSLEVLKGIDLSVNPGEVVTIMDNYDYLMKTTCRFCK